MNKQHLKNIDTPVIEASFAKLLLEVSKVESLLPGVKSSQTTLLSNTECCIHFFNSDKRNKKVTKDEVKLPLDLVGKIDLEHLNHDHLLIRHLADYDWGDAEDTFRRMLLKIITRLAKRNHYRVVTIFTRNFFESSYLFMEEFTPLIGFKEEFRYLFESLQNQRTAPDQYTLIHLLNEQDQQTYQDPYFRGKNPTERFEWTRNAEFIGQIIDDIQLHLLNWQQITDPAKRQVIKNSIRALNGWLKPELQTPIEFSGFSDWATLLRLRQIFTSVKISQNDLPDAVSFDQIMFLYHYLAGTNKRNFEEYKNS